MNAVDIFKEINGERIKSLISTFQNTANKTVN